MQGFDVKLVEVPEVLFNIETGTVERVLGILIENANKYKTPETEVEVRVTGGIDHASFEVANYGEIDESIDPFAPFERSPQHAHLPGSGVGLHTAARLIHEAGGNITYYQAGGQVVFSFRVPVGIASISPKRGLCCSPNRWARRFPGLKVRRDRR